MKRFALIQRLEQMGCIMVRHGGSHDWYTNPKAKCSQPVPRHSEIDGHPAKPIIKKLGDD